MSRRDTESLMAGTSRTIQRSVLLVQALIAHEPSLSDCDHGRSARQF